MYDYEKLGSFYLGRHYDLKQGQLEEDLLLYDSKDLTTHALCVGMTGSGKTGLCLSLLEEAAIDNIPAIAIDPKGDLGNLLLTFPNLEPGDFEPWVDEGAAQRKGLDRAAYAAQVAQQWREGLASWDEPPERIAAFREAVDLAIYTPGSNAGLPLSVLRSFAAPPDAVLNDADALRERVTSAVSGLLALLGIQADPIRSREHILLANLMDRAWRSGNDLDIAGLIGQVQSPPLEKVGVLDLETFYPEKDRLDLAMQLNNLLASPSFSAWLEGEPLDAQRLLHTPEGKPRLSIISIAHLSEQERMFVVTLLLSEVLSWVRSQPGTTSLRALLYMDEVFGYFPPTANPPSKTPMLTLLKQARAYGVGVVLATQNPVDLDYKGLSNTGTWFLGRLQTERDKMRVLEGLEGASAQAGSSFNKSEMEATLAGLGNRVFLMNNVHEDEPVVMQTRWALSYLRGPLTRSQIQTLMAPRKQAADTESGIEAESEVSDGSPGAAEQPGVLPADLFAAKSKAAATQAEEKSSAEEQALIEPPPGVPQWYAPCKESPAEGASIVYQPLLVGRAQLHFIRKTYDVDCWEDRTVLKEVDGTESGRLEWESSKVFLEKAARDISEKKLDRSPLPGAGLAALPEELGAEATFQKLEKQLVDFLYQTQEMPIWKSHSQRLHSLPGETEGDFRVRVQQAVREQRDEAVEELKQRYEKKIAAVEKKIASGRKRLEREKAQYRRAQTSTLESISRTFLGGLLGRKKVSATNLDRASGSLRSLGRAADQRSDVKEEEAKLEAYQAEIAALNEEAELEAEKLAERFDLTKLDIKVVSFRSRKNELKTEPLELLWVPWELNGDGLGRRLYHFPSGSE